MAHTVSILSRPTCGNWRVIKTFGFMTSFQLGASTKNLSVTQAQVASSRTLSVADRAWRAAAVLLLLAIFGLRVGLISETYMREDEEIAFRTTARDLGYTVYYQAEQDVHAPVWFVSFWLWQQLAGTGEFTARVYSILLSSLTLAVLYQLGRRWFGAPRYGVFAVLALGVSSYATIYALEIRPYALVMLLATVNMLLFRRWLVRRTWRSSLLYGASVAALLWTHYFLAFLVLAQLLYLALFQRLNRRLLQQLLGAGALALLLWSPWLPVFLNQIDTLKQVESASGDFRALGISSTTAATSPETVWKLVLLATNGQPLLYALVIAAGLWRWHGHPAYRLALVWALGVPGINLLTNLVFAVHTPRYLSYLTVGLALVVAAGLDQLPGRWRGFALGTFVAIAFWALPSQLPQHTPYRHVLQTMAAQAYPGDVVYYSGVDPTEALLRWQIDHYLTPELRVGQVATLHEAMAAHGVWFVTADFFDPQVQAEFRAIEAEHPLQVVAGSCNAEWCFLAQRLQGPPRSTPVWFGDQIAFWGMDNLDLSPTAIQARLWWRVERTPLLDYSISLRLVDASGFLVAQHDGPVRFSNGDIVQTSQLEPGGFYLDERKLTPLEPLPPGDYRLQLVIYQSWDGVRLTLPDGSDTLDLSTVSFR